MADNNIFINFTDFLMKADPETIQHLQPIWEEFKKLLEENHLLKIETNALKSDINLYRKKLYKAEYSHGSYGYDSE